MLFAWVNGQGCLQEVNNFWITWCLFEIARRTLPVGLKEQVQWKKYWWASVFYFYTLQVSFAKQKMPSILICSIFCTRMIIQRNEIIPTIVPCHHPTLKIDMHHDDNGRNELSKTGMGKWVRLLFTNYEVLRSVIINCSNCSSAQTLTKALGIWSP